jgi:DNA-binding response OmpR family regulator
MRILILEDDPLIALDLNMILESHGHCVVATCDTLAAARTALSTSHDFALLDIDLPDGKSFEIAAALSARQQPFAFVSASRPAEVPAALRAATFIPKPYRPSAILGALAAPCRAAA